MSNLLEVIRNLNHESCKYQKNIVEKMSEYCKSGSSSNTSSSSITGSSIIPEAKKRVITDHSIAYQLDKIKFCEKEVLRIYKDEKSLVDREISEMRSRNPLTLYYVRLNEIRKQFQESSKSGVSGKNSSAGASVIAKTLSGTPIDLNEENNLLQEVFKILDMKFSGEEYYGLYFDMHSLYESYLNVLRNKTNSNSSNNFNDQSISIDYKTYLKTFSNFDLLNRGFGKDSMRAVYDYLSNLLKYLIDFLERKHPLTQIEKLSEHLIKEFEETASDRLKEDQINLKNSLSQTQNKYCEICDRSFKISVYEGHLKGKRHRNKAEKNKKNHLSNGLIVAKNFSKEDEKQTFSSLDYQIKQLEFMIQVFAELLKKTVAETIAYIDKKQTRTYEELQKELEARMEADRLAALGNSLDDENNKDSLPDDYNKGLYTGGVYNPKGVPTGQDGKPIPYQLYKFHGLNIEYKCDICGGFSYQGIREFNRHFTEQRHSRNMRALGIPNDRAFMNITKIEDAESLWKKIQHRKMNDAFNASVEEEFEDNEGNVFGKQTYEALRRQRVI